MRHSKSKMVMSMTCPKCGGHKWPYAKQCRKCAYPDTEERPKRVVIAIAGGYSLKEVGSLLGVSEKRAQDWWMIAKSKFGVSSYAEAALMAFRLGWVDEYGKAKV